MFRPPTEQSENTQPFAITTSNGVHLKQAPINRTQLRERGFHKFVICATILHEARFPTKCRTCCCVTIQGYALLQPEQRDCAVTGSYLQLIWGGVRRLGGVYSEDVGQAAGHQQTHVLVGVFEEEVRGQVQGQVQVELLLFFRVLVHVHEGLHHHLRQVIFTYLRYY